MSHDDLLTRLINAQTEEERSWIVTESLLNSLSPELSAVAWAAAIPHWFDAEILTAMRPELNEQMDQLFERLRNLSFVERFPSRGKKLNIHERTRSLVLQHLWQKNPSEFRQISKRAADFFLGSDVIEEYTRIEGLYHRIIEDDQPQEIANKLRDFSNELNNSSSYGYLDVLTDTLMEQVQAGRATRESSAVVFYYRGAVLRRIDKNSEALDNYQKALNLFREIGDSSGEAATLKAISDVSTNYLALLKRKQELENRRLFKELQIISLKIRLHELGDAETALAIEELFVEAADRLVNLPSFVDRFCKVYSENKSTYNTVESIAQIVSGIIRLLAPDWIVDVPLNPAATAPISVLTATVLLKKGLDEYCKLSNREQFLDEIIERASKHGA